MNHFFSKSLRLVDKIVASSLLKENEDFVRLTHYVWLVLIAAPISLYFAYYNYTIKEFFLTFIIIFFASSLILSLFLVKHAKNIIFIYHTMNVVFILFIVTMIFMGGEEGSRILWAYTYPLASIFLFGSRTGSFWSLVLLSAISFIFYTSPWAHEVYSSSFQLRFFVTYLCALSITNWIEHYRNRYAKEAHTSHQELMLEKEHLNKEIARRVKLEKELLHQAQTDSLTTLLNRRHFWELAQKEVERAKRYDIALCMAVLDIDHFKKVNDTYGHPMGDEVLRAMARHCHYTLRSSDLLGRIGGEEFGFLLLHSNLKETHEKMESLRHTLEHMVITNPHYSVRFTVSIGVSELDDTIPTLDALYKKADEALYKAKEKGRNRIESTIS